jgi:hypothetical protein
MSGLQIFMAHPALYWGQFGADADWPAFEIGTHESGDGLQMDDFRTVAKLDPCVEDN